jgi:hypothetical protein
LKSNANAPSVLDAGLDAASTAAGAAAASTQTTVLQNFAGLNSVDSFDTNGFVLEPPDQGLCVGTFQGQKVVWELINNSVAIYSPAGALLAGPVSVNNFFGEPAATFMRDPRCYFDATTTTWFFTDLIVDFNSTGTSVTASHIDLLAVSTTGVAHEVAVDVTEAGNTAGQCPCLGNQPKLGIDPFNIYISVDQFDGKTLTFETGATLVAVSKSQLISGAATVNMVAFVNLSLLGIGITGLQPAITNSSTQDEFLLNAFEYQDAAQKVPLSTSHTLGLWALSHPQNVTAGSTPELNAVTISSERYSFPVQALADNGFALAAFSNDDRMQQVQFINGHLLAALDSAVLVKGDPVTRDGVAWFEIEPTLADATDIGGGKFVKQGYVATAGKYLIYPAIEQSTDGSTAIGFSFTNATINPADGFVISGPGSISFGHIHTTFSSPAPDNGFTCQTGTPQECRWGDYSWTALDPDGKDFWFADEDTLNAVATDAAGAKTNWGTEIWEAQGL